MKQLCPVCTKTVDVPDSAAGTEVPCPVCGSKIAVPKNYTPSVAVPPPPAAPAASAPPAPPGLAPPVLPTAAPTHSVSGDAKEVGFSVSSKIVDWIPAVCLTLAFLLTFFTWVGSYPGGHRLFAQNAWDAISRNISPNTIGMKDLDDVEKQLESVLVNSKWLWLYALLLIVTLVLSWAERFVKDLKPATVPGAFAWVLTIWPMRFRLLTILCCVLLFLFLFQSWRGFGLENAVTTHVTKQFETETKDADTAAKKTAVAVKQGQELAKFAVQTTTWYSLAFWAHVIAVVGMLLRSLLSKRAGRPNPQFLIRY